MYLTKKELTEMIGQFLQESIGLLNRYNDLKKEFNSNDFNPNEKEIENISKRLKIIDEIISSLQNYEKLAFKCK
jgi:protein subunit release factor A